MSFNNSGYVPSQINNLGVSIGGVSTQTTPRNLPLYSPMIVRIHNAKPGCSACGKKVA